MALDLRVRRALRDLAQRFIDDVVAAVAEASGGDESGAPRPPRQRVRRRAKKLEELGEAVLLALGQKGGVAVSEIARFVGSTPRELARPIAVLVMRGRITKIGERKGTRYFLAKPAQDHRAASARKGGEAPPRKRTTTRGRRPKRRR